MKRGSTIFLQIIVILAGLGALTLMLWFPHVEGRNAHSTPFQVYFHDPFLAYAYTASVAFYVALYQAYKVLGLAGQNRIFSSPAVKALRTIKYCALAMIAFVIGALLIISQTESDDRAGGVALGVVLTFGSLVVATAAAMFERILQKAVELKTESDLTV